MAMFTHLTPHDHVRSIMRTGLRAGSYRVPVLPSYAISHQWLRELRRGGQRTFLAVDFRLPDDQPVTVGHYGGPSRSPPPRPSPACRARPTRAGTRSSSRAGSVGANRTACGT
ncbi:hypothetical protein [Saccharothrix violaceirubra]|uniref:Uncharacterized protein n=1 Tax=Saccharothrix violaceirubra TaxID=413306 RepID=A0A7W7T1K0_9PSEU|nr:hypothetical protein [Saccharothrix violaceirubra]MBB4964377.1 hypothetical protein [Saccharothrix violaceirubra]